MPLPLFPSRIDNTYRGRRLAFWVLGAAVTMKIAQSLAILIGGASIVQAAHGVPLDTYSAPFAQMVVALFARAAYSRLLLALLCVLALIRYRSAIPFAFTLLALEFVGTQIAFYPVPDLRTETPVVHVVNLVLFALMAVGIALAMWRRRDVAARD
jgi:fumarate reductase subunit D